MNLLKDRFVAVDLETTGLDMHRDSIIKIGAVKCENGEIIEARGSFETSILNTPNYERKF